MKNPQAFLLSLRILDLFESAGVDDKTIIEALTPVLSSTLHMLARDDRELLVKMVNGLSKDLINAYDQVAPKVAQLHKTAAKSVSQPKPDRQTDQLDALFLGLVGAMLNPMAKPKT